jgi:hypothetical protein
MDEVTERRIVYVLCLAVLVFGLYDLSLGLSQSNRQAIGVSVLLIVLSVATPIAVWRSGRAGGETENEIDMEIDDE